MLVKFKQDYSAPRNPGQSPRLFKQGQIIDVDMPIGSDKCTFKGQAFTFQIPVSLVEVVVEDKKEVPVNTDTKTSTDTTVKETTKEPMSTQTKIMIGAGVILVGFIILKLTKVIK
jgi:hypothetical protein